MAKRTPKNREEAIKIAARRKSKLENPDEDKLQCKIVESYYNKYPETLNSLIGYDANGVDGTEGGIKQAMGVRRGVSDLLWFKDHNCHGLELKIPNRRHDAEHILEQCDFIINKCGRGAFIISLSDFWEYINSFGAHGGIPAEFVKKHIQDTGIKTVEFGKLEKIYENSL